MQRIRSERDKRPDNYTERSPKRCEVEVQVMQELFVESWSRTLPDGLVVEEMTWYFMAIT